MNTIETNIQDDKFAELLGKNIYGQYLMKLVKEAQVVNAFISIPLRGL